MVRNHLSTELEWLKQWLLTNPSPKESYETKHPRGDNLRMDFEYRDDAPYEEVIEAMLSVMEVDLADLIENGDVANTTDPCLKRFDGAKKRGVYPDEVRIKYALLIQEPKPKKQTVEYTLYVNLYLRWPSNDL